VGTPTQSIACRLGLDTPAALEATVDEPPHRSSWFPVHLSPETLAGQGLPVIDGRQLSPFRVDTGTAGRSIPEATACRLLASDRHRHPRLAYRDVASPTNRVTLIAAVLPARCVSTHTVFVLKTPLPLTAQYFLCGLFNSLVALVGRLYQLSIGEFQYLLDTFPLVDRAARSDALRQLASQL